MRCARCQAPLEHGDIRCPVCAFPSDVAVAGEAAAMKVLRCPECNAALAYSAEKQNAACGFCGCVMKVEEPVDPIETPSARLPLLVQAEQAKASLRRWLSTRGFFTPGDLATAATVDTIHPLWWAAWVCDAKATVSWTADSNAGSGRSDWAPHSGKHTLEWSNLVVPATRGLSAHETSTLTSSYDVSRLEPVPEGAAQVEQFDVQRSAARKTVIEGIERDAAERLKGGSIPGNRFRNVHVSALLEGLTTRRLAFPAWVLAYRFNGKLYRAVVHGQKADVVIGTSPLSWAKVALVGLGVLAAIALIALAVRQFA